MAYLRSVHMPFLFQIQFTSFSFFWVLVSVLVGIGYAFLLYRKKSELPKQLTNLLFALRTLTIAFITFLLFAPLVRTAKKSKEKPLIFIALDNSASLATVGSLNRSQYNEQIKKLIGEFDDDYEVKAFSFGGDVRPYSTLDFKDPVTNLSSALTHIRENYANRNIGAVILASDGIYNEGSNPQYEAKQLKAPVYSIALGDSVPRKDLVIANVNYNNLVYLGNDFQIEIEIEAFQSRGTTSRLSVRNNTEKAYEKEIVVNSDDFRLNVPVILPAKKKGIQKYIVEIAAVKGELTVRNNSFTFFVDVIDGKKKVFILANSPHPDISALKQSIESNKSYEVKTGFIGDYNAEDVQKSNLLILHQLPSANTPSSDLKKLTERRNCWYILGDQSNMNTFSTVQNLLKVAANGAKQEAFGKMNDDFYEFVLSDSTREKVKSFPPLLTPFGNYTINSQASVIVSQQIGKVVTNKPLLVVSKDTENKTAILCGEGLWRWRLDDFYENGSHQAVDELISKTVQYLSSADDKRKFRVYPAKTNFDASEHIILNAELYNKSYELVNTPDVSITVKSSSGKSYSFLFSRTGTSYVLNAGILPAGEYAFNANTQLGNEKFNSGGRFVVSQQLAEFRQTIANHQILQNIAAQSNGELIYPSEISALAEKVKNNELVKAIFYENRRYEDLISIKPLFFIALFLLTLEWLTRKRNGEL